MSDYGLGNYGAGPYGVGIGGVFIPPLTANITVEVAFGSNPGDATYTWTDITDDVRALQYSRGRQNELNRVDAGQGSLIVGDGDRKYDPDNTASPYYPDVRPMVPIRASITVAGINYPLFQHYVERWPRNRIGPNWAERQITTVDGFEILNQATLTPTYASLTTALGSNKDLVYTAVNPGLVGNEISIAYSALGAEQVTVSGSAITVLWAPGTPGPTLATVKNLISIDSFASALVTVENAPGSLDTARITAMSPTFLAGGGGGDFPAETTDARIHHALDAALWPAALRDIDEGDSSLDPFTFPVGSDVGVLSHLLDVTGPNGEQGLMFVDANGVLVFRSRHAPYRDPYSIPEISISDQPGELHYIDLINSYDKDLIYNTFSGKRETGERQFASDDTSITKYLIRRAPEVSSQLDNDNDVLALLQWRLLQFKEPLARIESVTVMPANDTETWRSILNLELGDRITVQENPPGGGTPTERDYTVQHIDAAFREGPPVSAVFRFALWPVDTNTWLILDDPVYGLLDSGNNLGA